MNMESLVADLRGQQPEKEAVDLVPREVSLHVSYSCRGTTRKATITSVVPDGAVRARIRRGIASQTDGLPWESFSGSEQYRMRAAGTVFNQIIDMPQWLIEAALEDDQLLLSLHEGVADHTARYFRGDDGEGGSEEGVPRVVVALADRKAS